jgi:ankyrin repeat protein
MKHILLFLAFIMQSSFILSMDPAEHIKRQIRQFQAEGADTQEIAQLSTIALRELLEYPLVHTPAAKYLDLYKTLVETGGDKNVKHPKNGKTALMFAALDGRPDIVKGLLDLGVDPAVMDNNGNTAANLINSPWNLLNPSSGPEIRLLLYEAEIALKKSKIT